MTTLAHTAPDLSGTVWVTDAELIRRSGVPEKVMRQNLRALDDNPRSGFPKKDRAWGGRRHWPSVLRYWEQRAERASDSQQKRWSA